MILIKTNTHTLTRNWILIKRNYEKLWFSGKEYEYLYYNWARTSNTHKHKLEKFSWKVRNKQKKNRKKKIAIGFFFNLFY